MDRTRGGWPVVVLWRRFGTARETTFTLTDDLSSRGCVVVSISHPSDAEAVDFPGGRLVTNSIEPLDQKAMKTAIDTRVGDARLALDEMPRLDRGQHPDAERDPLPRGLVGSLHLDEVGIYRHS